MRDQRSHLLDSKRLTLHRVGRGRRDLKAVPCTRGTSDATLTKQLHDSTRTHLLRGTLTLDNHGEHVLVVAAGARASNARRGEAVAGGLFAGARTPRVKRTAVCTVWCAVLVRRTPPGVMYAGVAAVFPLCSASMVNSSLLCEHWSQLAHAVGQPAKGQPVPTHVFEPGSFRLKRNSPAQGPTPQYVQQGKGDHGKQPHNFGSTPATVSASITLFVYSGRTAAWRINWHVLWR